MAVETQEEFRNECAELVGDSPAKTGDEKPVETTPPVETPAAKAPEEKPAEAPAKPETHAQEGTPDKPLQRLQQKQAALERELASLRDDRKAERDAQARRDKEWKKLLAVNGVDEEPETPAPAPAPASSADDELRLELAETRREIRFTKLEHEHPGFKADTAWQDSIDAVLELHGIEKNATELPEGLTLKALETAASKIFERKLASHKAPPPPTAPSTPKPRLTPSGNGARKQVSHVPSPTPRTPDTYDFRRECAELAGLTDS